MLVEKIEANPNSFAPNVGGVSPGSIVVDPSGASQNVGVVNRLSAHLNGLVIIPGLAAVMEAGAVVWTPSSSGDGTLAITVNNSDGDPIEGVEVEITLLAGTALTGVTPSLATITYQSGLTSTNALIRGLTDAGGHMTLAIDGTASTALRYTVRLIGLPQVGSWALSAVVVSASVTLPA